MTTSFHELCRHLHIQSPVTDKDLKRLMQWCHENITTDIHFEGTFDAYKNLATRFFEQIKPNIQKSNLTAPVPQFDNKTSLQELVDSGFDVVLKLEHPSSKQVNTKINGTTLLFIAAIRGYVHTTKTLLSLGANPLEHDTQNIPLLFATLMLPMDYDDTLLENKTLIYLLLSEYFESVTAQRNDAGDTVLHLMCIHGYDTLTEQLISNKKTQELAFITNDSTRYPIHSAILNAHHHCASSLMSLNGVAELTDGEKRTPLHYAAMYGDSEMVSICFNQNTLESRDIEHLTPLMLATIHNNVPAIKTLLDCGAEINAKDDDDKTALDYAIASGNPNSLEAFHKVQT